MAGNTNARRTKCKATEAQLFPYQKFTQPHHHAPHNTRDKRFAIILLPQPWEASS